MTAVIERRARQCLGIRKNRKCFIMEVSQIMNLPDVDVAGLGEATEGNLHLVIHGLLVHQTGKMS